jgi:hypothetical protein
MTITSFNENAVKSALTDPASLFPISLLILDDESIELTIMVRSDEAYFEILAALKNYFSPTRSTTNYSVPKFTVIEIGNLQQFSFRKNIDEAVLFLKDYKLISEITCTDILSELQPTPESVQIIPPLTSNHQTFFTVTNIEVTPRKPKEKYECCCSIS